MPKREDTTRDGYQPMPKPCPDGHWIGLRCGECENARLERHDFFANVIWSKEDNGARNNG